MTVPKRFGILRFFGTLLKVIAWIILIVAAAIAVVAVVAGSLSFVMDVLRTIFGDQANVVGATGGILFGIGALLIGFLYFLIFYVSGELIHLQLAVEENTRLTAALLLRMHQDGQAENASAYTTGGGFINEPYEN
jgi:hypothetical protein